MQHVLSQVHHLRRGLDLLLPEDECYHHTLRNECHNIGMTPLCGEGVCVKDNADEGVVRG